MKVGLEKVDTYKEVSVKALLDSGATGMFDRKFVEKWGFKKEELDRLVMIWNVDGTGNSGGLVTEEIECNMYFQGHVERIRMDVCNLEKTEVILGIPWLAAHNPEINWKKGEVRMMRCPPLCGKNKKQKIMIEGKVEVRITEAGEKTVEELVPRKFWKWKKVFENVESERMFTRKPWDHAIELKEGFVPRKEKVL